MDIANACLILSGFVLFLVCGCLVYIYTDCADVGDLLIYTLGATGCVGAAIIVLIYVCMSIETIYRYLILQI